MPPWVSEVGRLLIGIAAIIFSLGFVTVTWKAAWALRGWVETEKSRARVNEELVSLVKEFIDSQKVANELQRHQNDEIWTAIQVHAFRLNDLEKTHERADRANPA